MYTFFFFNLINSLFSWTKWIIYLIGNGTDNTG